MWFALALLFFSLVYGCIRLASNRSPRNDPEAPLPGHGQIVGLALLMGLCSFLVRIVQPMGTNILNMQLCFFSQYILLFVVGIYAGRRNWLLRIPYAFGMRWLAAALSVGMVAWSTLAYFLLKTHSEDKLGGGFTWQSATIAFGNRSSASESVLG